MTSALKGFSDEEDTHLQDANVHPQHQNARRLQMKAKDTVKRNVHYRCLEYDHDQEGDICLVACGMERCDPGINFGPEVRDCYHLHVVLSGTGVLLAGGKEFHPHFGQMFLLKDNLGDLQRERREKNLRGNRIY